MIKIIILVILILIIYIFNYINLKENMDNKENNIYIFWTGDNEMSENRKKSIENLKNTCECNIILVTPLNLKSYILSSQPLHEAYQYLSYTHKSDYLRTYFMHFIGGGYSDIKKNNIIMGTSI